ncbi:MAG: hypothetical protein ACKOCJ_01220 [Burkholderiaceae bacterium]
MNTQHPTSTPHLQPTQRVQYGQRPHKPGLYLGLFHGRDDPKARMDDWGDDGPAIGPLRWCHTTYASTLRINFVDAADAALYFGDDFDGEVPMHEDMLMYEGRYYGDWTVYWVAPDECANPDDTFRQTSRKGRKWGHWWWPTGSY